MEMNPNDKSFQSFRESLTRGEIPLGEGTVTTDLGREKFLKVFAGHFEGKPMEWRAQNNRWNKEKLIIEILWYPVQPVFFTFRNGDLALIEFYGLGEPGPGWNYSLEAQNYFRTKNDVVKHLGKENRSSESDMENMEAVWHFAKLTLYVACDAKTGGCGIGLRSKL
jgi:hypothetical protein